MLVKVYKLGEEEEALTSFPLGTHLLGRGPALQCNDKRVSRNHATLEITPDDVKLTSLHINPCFLKSANSKTITILPKDSTTQLNDGDRFAFLPEDFWFKIQIIIEDEPTDEAKQPEEVLKRPLDTTGDTPPDKRTKTDTNDNDETVQTTTEATTSTNGDDATSQVQDAEAEPDEPVKTEVVDNDPPQNEEVTSSQDLQQGSQASGADGNPGSSNPRPRREKCWYGAECYRKNALHRQDYRHPGDSDFESDPDDNRPTCSYGAACYRKNKGHRRDYKHPPGQPPSKTKKKRSRKKTDRLNVANSEDLRDLDLSDSEEDPFVVDDDSDEYVGDSDEADSDWEPSQNADEDSENIRRLVKEANKFVKK